MARAAAAIAVIVSSSTVFSEARLAMDEDPPALDADLVGGDAHARIVKALPGAQVEALLEDGRGYLRDSSAVADDSPRDDKGLAEGVEVVNRVDGRRRSGRWPPVGPPPARTTPVPGRISSSAQTSSQSAGVASSSATALIRPPAGNAFDFSSQVPAGAGRAPRTQTRLGSGALEFTKVRKLRALCPDPRASPSTRSGRCRRRGPSRPPARRRCRASRRSDTLRR